MQMNEHVRDWVAALRSGDYQQAHGYMKLLDHDSGEIKGYCCLGVASELAGCQFQVPESYDVGQLGVVYDAAEPAVLDHLPRWLRELLTLTEDDERVLVSMNDGGSNVWNSNPRHTFDDIADAIEAAANEGRELRAKYTN